MKTIPFEALHHSRIADNNNNHLSNQVDGKQRLLDQVEKEALC